MVRSYVQLRPHLSILGTISDGLFCRKTSHSSFCKHRVGRASHIDHIITCSLCKRNSFCQPDSCFEVRKNTQHLRIVKTNRTDGSRWQLSRHHKREREVNILPKHRLRYDSAAKMMVLNHFTTQHKAPS
jgi:hypothetical protein